MPTQNPTVLLSPDTVTLAYKGRVNTFRASAAEYTQLKEIMKVANATERNEKLVGFAEALKIKAKTGSVAAPEFRESAEGTYVKKHDGTEALLPPVLGQRLLEFVKEGLPYEPLLLCAKRLLDNPSYNAVQRTFGLLEKNHHPILEDGRILFWKRVRSDFKDIYSGTFDNSVGKVVSMPRNEVDEDSDRTCSRGLHTSSYSYAAHSYGSGQGVLLEVAVCPSQIVAVPKDYNSQKCRVASYEVLSVCEEEDKSELVNHSNGFAVDPNSENVCEDCDEHQDFCQCYGDEDDDEVVEDDDDEDDNLCPDCSEEFDDCSCSDEEDDEY